VISRICIHMPPYHIVNRALKTSYKSPSLNYSLTRFQSMAYSQQPNKPLIGSFRGRIKPFPFGLTLVALTLTSIAIYLFLEDGDKVNLAIAAKSRVLLLPVSKKYLVNELFSAVDKGDFNKAKSILELSKIDVNEKRFFLFSKDDEVLLEAFFPKTESNLQGFMDFADFIMKRGYKHLNRPIGGKEGNCNLLTNIYNRHIFTYNPDLRRKLVAFFLEEGIDPFYKNRHSETALHEACCHGDGTFFIDTCARLKIQLGLDLMNGGSSLHLLEDVIIHGNAKDLVYLLKSGLKVGSNKDKLLESLNKWSFSFTKQGLKEAKEALENAQTIEPVPSFEQDKQDGRSVTKT
jgi:hypothetical protein